MENASSNTKSIKRTTLDYLENQIDIWNRTATRKKAVISSWRKRVFVLVLFGTLCGLLSEQVLKAEGTWLGSNNSGIDPHEILAIASALSIALATFAGAQILTSDLEKEQIKSRSTAEAIKVQAYLYVMNAPPYSGKNPEKRLYKRVENILKEVSDITPYIALNYKKGTWSYAWNNFITLGAIARDKKKDVWVQKFDENITFEAYIQERVEGQINGYYLKKAGEFQRIIKRGNAWSLVFGFAGVGVGAIGATSSSGNGASMWIAFLSTAGASIGSYLYSNKFEYLMMSYVTTASQLELMSAKNKSMVTPSLRTQRKFIAEVESVFAMEHNSWISEISGGVDDDDEDELADEELIYNDTTLSNSDTDSSEEDTELKTNDEISNITNESN